MINVLITDMNGKDHLIENAKFSIKYDPGRVLIYTNDENELLLAVFNFNNIIGVRCFEVENS